MDIKKRILGAILLIVSMTIQAQGQIYIVEKKSLKPSLMQYDGTLVPGREVELICPIQAMVVKTHFEYGDSVLADQLLFELDPKESEMALAVAKTELYEQTHQVEKLKNWQSSTDVIKAQYNLNREQKLHEYAKEHYKQTEKLYGAGIISKEEYLSDQRQYEDSLHHYQNAKDILEEVLKKGDDNYLQLALMKQKQVEQKIALLEGKLNSAKINSPIKGVILAPSEKGKTPSQSIVKTVQPGQVMAVIADMERLAVEIKIDELDIVNVQKGQPAKIEFFAFPNKAIRGEVQDIHLPVSANHDSNSLTKYLVRIKLKDIDPKIKDRLLLGFTAKVNLFQADFEGLVIPKVAIQFDQSKHFVTVLRDNKPLKQEIEITNQNENEVQVLTGLKQGDRVVLPG